MELIPPPKLGGKKEETGEEKKKIRKRVSNRFLLFLLSLWQAQKKKEDI